MNPLKESFVETSRRDVSNNEMLTIVVETRDSRVSTEKTKNGIKRLHDLTCIIFPLICPRSSAG